MSEVKYCDKLFYKYRPINKHTESLLINNELFFNHSDNFNDPFDCKPETYHKGTQSEWMNFLNKYNMHPIKAKNTLKDNMKNGKMKRKSDGILLENKAKLQLENHPDDGTFIRACCFSERKDSLLMWGHYAKDHEGICLSFKSWPFGDYYLLPLATDGGLPFHKVTYKDIKPKPVNLLNRNTEETTRIVYDFFLTKFTDWQYESEYRLLETVYGLNGKDIVKFQKNALEGITFGLKVKPDNAQCIKDIVDQYYEGLGIKLYRTKKIDKKYAVDFKEIRNFDKYIALLNKE